MKKSCQVKNLENSKIQENNSEKINLSEEEPYDIEYEGEEEEEEVESEVDLSDIDDDELLKRLEAKYGKLDDKGDDDEDEGDEAWTSKFL